MMRFLVDMNLSPAWVGFLNDAGFAALHWSEVGRPDAPDRELMQWAAAQDHIVITCDLDFSTILAATGHRKPSVVQIRSDVLTPALIGGTILLALARTQRELESGALISVEPGRTRVRILPFVQ